MIVLITRCISVTWLAFGELSDIIVYLLVLLLSITINLSDIQGRFLILMNAFETRAALFSNQSFGHPSLD